ncbi:DoxX family protein [uncultured Tessaracoccus sp.]|uniref:DoxX family protein n=1 Tax=uncultured Tessaracoccus sp. TaxID=905023 RepID=UPI0026378B44|nr:DoxX family protein [uncultured Tessaracoccus sp.]
MVRSWVKGFQHVALMLARVAIGVILIARGWHRWFTVGIDQQATILANADIPAPDLCAWLVTIFELAGGVLLVFGLFTPAIGFGVLVLNIGVIVLRKLDAFYIHDGGFEYNLAMAAVGLLFLAFGSGKLGADALFFTPTPEQPREVVAPEPTPPSRPTETTLFSQQTHR